MAVPHLVNRIRFTSSLKKELAKKLDELAKETRIAKTRLLDEAVEDLLKKYDNLVNRIRFTSSLKKELAKKLDELAKETRIAKTRLLDEAVEDLLKKYDKQ